MRYTKEDIIIGVEGMVERIEFNIYLNSQTPTYSEPTYSDEEMFEYVAIKELHDKLLELLSTLSPREEKVLRLRFGLDDGKVRLLEEVGKELGITRERARQFEASALRKLRDPSRRRELEGFLK